MVTLSIYSSFRFCDDTQERIYTRNAQHGGKDELIALVDFGGSNINGNAGIFIDNLVI